MKIRKNTARKSLFALMIFIILILTGCTEKLSEASKTDISNAEQEATPFYEKLESIKEEIIKEEILKTDMLSCNKDSNPLNCIRNYLVGYYIITEFKLPTPGECRQLNDKAAREDCLTWLAYIKKDISICEQGDERCLSTVGGLIGDVEVCEKISENSIYKDHCFVDAARTTRSNTTCEKIKDKKLLFYCKKAIEQGLDEEIMRSIGMGLLNKREIKQIY